MSARRTGAERKEPRNIREEIFLLPNLLTLGRIVLIPVVVGFMLVDTRLTAFIATLLFAVAAITDFLDGYIARNWGLQSLWGQFLDPLADKLIVMATTVTLVFLRVGDPASAVYGEAKLPVWLVVLLISREIAITSLRGMANKEGFVIEVIQSGKWKTALQLVGLTMLLIGYTYHIDYIVWAGRVDFVVIGRVMLAGSVLFSLISAWQYLRSFVTAIAMHQNYEPVPKRAHTSPLPRPRGRQRLAGLRKRILARKASGKTKETPT
jgi:CDP-diacylglycerol--glycerol-3-phosphate 3-phosphatidyltransferase